MKYKKITALFLAAVMLLQLCGCSLFNKKGNKAEDVISSTVQSAQETLSHASQNNEDSAKAVISENAVSEEQDREPSNVSFDDLQINREVMLCGGGYYTNVAREPIDYTDIEYEVLELDEFTELVQTLREAADTGSLAKFHAALYDCEAWLSKIYTMYALAEIISNRDSTDAESSDEVSRVLDIYYDADDAFSAAMYDFATADDMSLMEAEFEDWQIEYFLTYDPDIHARSAELGTRETDLQHEYEELIGEDNPDYDRLGEIYLELVAIWKEEASLAGYDDFCTYAYENYYSRNYTPEEAKVFWDLAKHNVLDLLVDQSFELSDEIYDLYYSDIIDTSEDAVIHGILTGAYQMSPEIASAAQFLKEHKLYDIDDSENRVSTGYTVYLQDADVPFIFNAPYGTYYDYTDMFHEFGHWLAQYYNKQDLLFGIFDYDFCELQSQGMEVMFMNFYDDIFGEENASLIRADVITNLLYSVFWGGFYDEFQQRIFHEENLTMDKVQEIYKSLCGDYGLSWSTKEQYDWMNTIHNFESPMYYISYGVSALSALELFLIERKDPEMAMDTYLRLSALNNEEYYMTEVLDIVGLSNVFEKETGRDIIIGIRSSKVLLGE